MPRLPCLVAVLALIPGPPAAFAGPADPLLRLAPPDAAFCFVFQDVRTHVHTVNASPFADWASQSAVGDNVRSSPEAKKLQTVAGFLQATLGVSGQELLDDVFGDAVVFAYRPGPPGRPKDESGVILIRPRKPDVLARLIDKLNETQTAGGELKEVRDATHRDRAYKVRVKATGESEFYLLHGDVFAFSGQEAVIKAIIDRDRDAPPAEEAPSAVADGLRRLGVQDKAAVAWLNPRQFDAELAANAATAKDANGRAFLSQFMKLWAATDGVAVFAHPDRGLGFGITAAVRRDAVPKELIPVLYPPSGGSAVWAAVPPNAIVAVGGRGEIPTLIDAYESFLPGEWKKPLRAAIQDGLGPVFGKDKLPVVARGLGPDWAAWVAPPAEGDKDWIPRAAAAVRLADGEPTRVVTQALDLAFQLARIGYNQAHPDQIDFGEEKRNEVTVKYLSNEIGFPPGFRPCYAVKGGWLMLASSPAVVAVFTPPDGAAADAPLVRLSGRHLREYLDRYREPVAKAVAASDQKPAGDVAAGLKKLAGVLEALDRAELRYDAGNDKVSLTVRVELVKPQK